MSCFDTPSTFTHGWLDVAGLQPCTSHCPSTEFGLAKCGVLVRLYACTRASRRKRSPRAKFLKSARSIFELPGPRRISRPAVPGALKTTLPSGKSVAAGKAKAELGLASYGMFVRSLPPGVKLLFTFGAPIKSARVAFGFPFTVTLNGRLDCSV